MKYSGGAELRPAGRRRDMPIRKRNASSGYTNYYDELGIGRDASSGEIRQAYRQMARLLHPDSQSDPSLKVLAERQMKRLGEITAILGDSRKRREYDDWLVMGNMPRLSHRELAVMEAICTPAHRARLGRFGVRHWFWILTGMTVLGLVGWGVLERGSNGQYAIPRVIAPPGATISEQRKPQTVKPSQKHTMGWTKARIPNASKPFDMDDPVPLEDQPSKVPVPPRPAPALQMNDIALSMPSLPGQGLVAQESLIEVVEAPASQRQPSPGDSSFAGRWLYSPAAADPITPGQYPATYVEFLLVEESRGTLVGDYKAQYRIPDRAIAPSVTFQARGPAAPIFTTLSWTSHAGAKGKAELMLRTPDVLRITWWTTEVGREEAMGSGTAVLVRQREP